MRITKTNRNNRIIIHLDKHITEEQAILTYHTIREAIANYVLDDEYVEALQNDGIYQIPIYDTELQINKRIFSTQ